MVVVLIYGVLFMDWGEMAGRDVKPFAGVWAIPIPPSNLALLTMFRYANGSTSNWAPSGRQIYLHLNSLPLHRRAMGIFRSPKTHYERSEKGT